MTNLLGKTISEYHLKEVVGEGGMATVYKAFQPSLGRSVAVKVMHQRYSDLLPRFQREARAVALLRHRNILAIYDYGEEDGYAYLVMEFVAQGTLKEMLTGQPIDWVTTVALGISVGEALHYAHQNGIVHRDVKPTNILMPSPDWPLLADFGLVKVKSSDENLTDSGTIIGTPEYISPEQASGEPVDHRADIYALGVIIFEMITGRLPFNYTNLNQIMIAHITEPVSSPVELNPDCPPKLEQVILKAMEKDPDDRYGDMAAMVEALKDVIGSSTLPKGKSFNSQDVPSYITNLSVYDSLTSQVVEQEVKLVVIEQNVTLDIPVDAEKLIVGRTHGSHRADIDLGPYGAATAGVSRKHICLIHDDERWTLEDLGSLNGTFVNDVKLKPQTPITLKSGDVIRCGHMPLIFRILDQKEP
ncbi:MAG: protein kinase [Anaerolineae bacterium]|nr:protein kinase [Anaerolineae bacterium]